jgi:hypothetical protein
MFVICVSHGLHDLSTCLASAFAFEVFFFMSAYTNHRREDEERVGQTITSENRLMRHEIEDEEE